MLRLRGLTALVLVVGGCAGPVSSELSETPALSDRVELQGGFYRRVGDHWVNVPAGIVMTHSDSGGYCGMISVSLMSGSGSRVCLYDDTSDRRFNRAAIVSESRILQLFSFDVPIPYTKIEPATWPAERLILNAAQR